MERTPAESSAFRDLEVEEMWKGGWAGLVTGPWVGLATGVRAGGTSPF